MANNEFSGTLYCDSTGQLTSKKNIKVAYILYTSSAAADSITLRDGTAGSDPIKLKVQNILATDTKVVDLSNKPIVFQNGVYCSAISASSVATLILTQAGEG
jgi:hypothetical protein